MTEEETARQKMIDDFYDEVWSMADEVSFLKERLYEIGEALKPFVSTEKFK